MTFTPRAGWGEEDGAMIHLESEMAVLQDEVHGDWVIEDVEEVRHGIPCQSPDEAMDQVDESYNANPRHSLEWSSMSS